MTGDFETTPDNPSRDNRAGLCHRLLYLENTLMNARGNLGDVIIAIMDANDAARRGPARPLLRKVVPTVAAVRCHRPFRPPSTNER